MTQNQNQGYTPFMSQLAGNPEHPPLLAKTVLLRNGQELVVADPRAIRALIALMDMQAVLAGAASHFGGPSAFAELMATAWGYVFHSAQTKGQPWHVLFQMINDAGHCENGLYALKALTAQAGVTLQELKSFRSLQSRLTGHGEVHVFPEGVYLSNGPLGSALPQAQGLAMADCLAGSSRITVTAVSDGGLMEGEAREALASIPGLAARGRLNPFIAILSDNNTKLTGRIDRDSFSMAPTFASLETLGWDVIYLEHGHDLQKCAAAFEDAVERARGNPQRPVFIHAKTIKGFGSQMCMESASGGHGFPVKNAKDVRAFVQEIYFGEQIPELFLPWLQELENLVPTPSGTPAVKKEKIQVGVAKALIALKQNGLPLVSVTADLPGSTGLLEFQKKYPECTFDVGVAEANMISVAAGFSRQGYIPIVDTFAQFGVTKGALPLTMAVLSEAPVIAIFSHTGFQDAADGASHQALSYLSQVGSIPNTQVYALTCSSEAEALITQAVEHFHQMRAVGKVPPNMIFFLGREDFPVQFVPAATYQLDQGQILFDSSPRHAQSVVLLAAGSLVGEALAAAESLDRAGTGVVVINPSRINAPDVALLKRVLEKCQGCLITLEDHQVRGGLAGYVVPVLLQHGVRLQKLKCLGVQDVFGRSAYQATELYRLHGLDREGIIKAVRELRP